MDDNSSDLFSPSSDGFISSADLTNDSLDFVPTSPPLSDLSSLSSLSPTDFSDLNSSDDVTVQKAASAAFTNYTEYISILMGILATVSLFLNLGFVGTILYSRKLRASILYMLFVLLAFLCLLDILAIMVPSLLCLSNDHWVFGHGLCRLNAFAQQFVFLASLFALTLMAMERALGLIGRHLVTARFFGLLSVLFLVAPLCFAAPLFLHGFPVSVYPFRYLCAIGDGSPLFYSVAQILVYGGCLFVLLLCFGSVLKHKRAERSLPVKSHDYGAFIMESRALEEHMMSLEFFYNLSRTVLYLVMEFLIIQGPYICLDFFMQLRNSSTFVQQFGGTFLMARDVDTLITVVKLFHPMFVPLLIYSSCGDIWTMFINLLCCRRPNFDPSQSQWTRQFDHNGSVFPVVDSVFTVFATPQGLQLRLPYQHQQSQLLQPHQPISIAKGQQGVETTPEGNGGGETKAKKAPKGRRRRRGRLVKQAWK